ncbi:hypothetical protein SUGI_0309330 [Cryptomeria japonica]|nr:hypothetical protein SUGI_0309330 [Cryptomeria japonica]
MSLEIQASAAGFGNQMKLIERYKEIWFWIVSKASIFQVQNRLHVMHSFRKEGTIESVIVDGLMHAMQMKRLKWRVHRS